jgi:hypothetical protein
MIKMFKIILMWAVILSATGVTYVYAASNTNSTSNAGEGLARSGGYVVTNLEYHFASDPAYLDAVSLDLDQPAAKVMVKLIAADSHYYPCVNTNGTHWQCDVGQTDISSVDQFGVIASSN